jgi:hypothetical protein
MGLDRRHHLLPFAQGAAVVVQVLMEVAPCRLVGPELVVCRAQPVWVPFWLVGGELSDPSPEFRDAVVVDDIHALLRAFAAGSTSTSSRPSCPTRRSSG